MKRNHSGGVWDTLLIVTVAALAVTFAQATQAVASDAEEPQAEDGRVVEISPQHGDDQSEEKAVDEQPAYWLGIEGGPLDSDVLRTHLQLADDVGIVVRAVSGKSPAEKAGLRQHDVIIGVGSEQVSGMGTLQKAVADSNGKPIELKVIRLAKEEKIAVTPEKMPEDIAQAQQAGGGGGGFNFNFNDMPMGDLNRALKDLQGGVRVFGPGMILNGQGVGAGSLPGGVSVAITREGDGPAKITVKKGDKTWNIEGNDEKALEQLPEDVRPFVSQMLHGAAGPNIMFRQQFQLPEQVRVPFPGRAAGGDMEAVRKRTEEASKRMMKQMEQMEKQLHQMQQRFEERFPAEGTNPGADPSKT
jgi:membrane-associated protease RseP (regulator of RpoE activity)